MEAWESRGGYKESQEVTVEVIAGRLKINTLGTRYLGTWVPGYICKCSPVTRTADTSKVGEH